MAIEKTAAVVQAPRVNSERLSWKIKLLYGAPNFAGAALIIPILVNMPKFYADVVLVPLGFLAIAIALARSLDAISDPIVGWISDRTRTRLGRRRPYLILGAPLCGLAFWKMLSPPEHLTGNQAALWFGVTFTLYFISYFTRSTTCRTTRWVPNSPSTITNAPACSGFASRLPFWAPSSQPPRRA